VPRVAKTEETQDLTADQIAVDGLVEESIAPSPPQFDQAQLQSMISRSVSEALVTQLMALLPEMVTTIAGPTNQNGPTGTTRINMVEDAPVKQTFLKHYRMDGVLSGKYQLLDVEKLDENGEIPYTTTHDPSGRMRIDSPAVMKGEWVHFQNGHFYATKPIEVAYVEWRIRTDPQFRVYEDTNIGGEIVCGVANCGIRFSDEATLAAHMKATHGV
jgi:hypothetical protein